MNGSTDVVTPQAAGRRAARSLPAQPAYAPGGETRRRTFLVACAATAWVLAWLVATGAALDAVVDVPLLPEWARTYGAAALAVLFSIALARRCGGRVWFWTLLAVGFMALVLLAEQRWLFSSAAVFVAVVGAVTSVLLTRPAPTYVRVLLEYAIALLLAVSAALAVAGFDAPVNTERYNLLVLALTLAASLALVWRLGAGYHGLGRRGALLIVAGAVLVTAVLVYTRVLREYGSTSVTATVEGLIDWTRARLNAVPRPIEVFVGFPALLWGVYTRAHRRQGWWMCAFATFGTATVATTLARQGVDPAYAGRSLLYSIGFGLLIGLVVLRLDAIAIRRRAFAAAGRRARRHQPEAQPLRPEPGRAYPLR